MRINLDLALICSKISFLLFFLVGLVGCKVGADEITFRFGFDLLPLLLSFARWLLLRMHLELALMDTIALFCLVFLVVGLSCGLEKELVVGTTEGW